MKVSWLTVCENSPQTSHFTKLLREASFGISQLLNMAELWQIQNSMYVLYKK